MNNKITRPQILSSGSGFHYSTRLVALIVIIVLLTLLLSARSGHANPLSSVEVDASAQACPAGMVAYWKLDETGGTTFTDPVGNNHATCEGDNCPVNFPAGKVNSALEFDVVAGVGDELNVPHHSSLSWDNADSFSVEAWVNTTQLCSGNKVFVGRHSGKVSWWLGCSTANSVATFSARDSDKINHTVQTSISLKDGNWHHVVGIRDGTNNLNMVYVDGVLRASQTPATPYTGNFISTQPLTLGYHNYKTPGFHFDGVLDEVAIYSHVLTAAEIAAHYNGGAGQAYCDAVAAPAIFFIPNLSTVANQSFTYDVEATGSPSPTFSLSKKPSGMTIDTLTGVISWTPTTTGTFDVTVKATNSQGSDEKSFTVTVTAAPFAPVITAIPNKVATLDALFTYTVIASGSPSPTFSLTQKPAGMTINANTGVITWTPDTTGTFDVTVKATNSAGSNSKSFKITVSTDFRLFLPAILKN